MVTIDPSTLLAPACQKEANFTTTHWSVVLAAGADSTSAAALEELCGRYWYPLYAYVRRHGYGPHDAQDLVQDFFARFLRQQSVRLADRNRGRFRTFLLTSVKRFLINESIKARRQKRGNGEAVLSLDEERAEGRFALEPATEQSPDTLYDRNWGAVLLERAVAALRAEFETSGRTELFERVKDFVWGETCGLSYAEMAKQLAMSEGAVKVAVHRLRQRFRELLRLEIAQTVSTPVEVDAELRYLVTVMRDGRSAVTSR